MAASSEDSTLLQSRSLRVYVCNMIKLGDKKEYCELRIKIIRGDNGFRQLQPKNTNIINVFILKDVAQHTGQWKLLPVQGLKEVRERERSYTLTNLRS